LKGELSLRTTAYERSKQRCCTRPAALCESLSQTTSRSAHRYVFRRRQARLEIAQDVAEARIVR